MIPSWETPTPNSSSAQSMPSDSTPRILLTTRGKSLAFLILITVGYVCGISAKLLAGNITYVFFFYVLNLCMLLTELALYARNLRLDRQRAEEPAA